LTCQLYQLARAQPALCARIRSGWLAGLALALIVVLFAMFRYLANTNLGWRSAPLVAGVSSQPAHELPVRAGLLLADLLACARGGAVGRALSSPWARFLGDISYPRIYRTRWPSAF